MSVRIVTSLWDIIVDLFTDRCPLAYKNFLKLCKIKYYNNCLFHTVRKNITNSKRGTAAMAVAGTGEKNLNASQFYITLRDDLNSLDGEHAIFG
uniref:PPIase cyclophilin-type domain-containing protein n=1 Tax=Solanum lycopersicum TaxID=4081 RepID=K4DEF8_SOLLC